MFGNLPIFNTLRTGLHWAAERSQKLTENLTNQEIPHYKAMDLAPLSAESLNASYRYLTTTNPLHMNPYATQAGFKTLRMNGQASLSGNNVDPQEQMTKLSETSSKYMTWVNLFKSLTSRGVSAVQSLA